MGLPTEVNYEVYSGDTFEVTIPYTGSENITGATARMQLRSNLVSSLTSLEVTPSISTAPDEIVVTLSPAETSALISGTVSKSTYVYDIEITFANSKVLTLQKGTVVVYLDVTR